MDAISLVLSMPWGIWVFIPCVITAGAALITRAQVPPEDRKTSKGLKILEALNLIVFLGCLMTFPIWLLTSSAMATQRVVSDLGACESATLSEVIYANEGVASYEDIRIARNACEGENSHPMGSDERE